VGVFNNGAPVALTRGDRAKVEELEIALKGLGPSEIQIKPTTGD